MEINIRRAVKEDCARLLELIRELAESNRCSAASATSQADTLPVLDKASDFAC